MTNIKNGTIYMITSPTNRIYIGSTVNLKRRIIYYKSNLGKSQIKLYNSFKKYGWENHKFEVIWTGPIEDMLKYETLIGFGFNVLEPENLNCKLPKYGENFSFISEETRQKMSAWQIGRKMSNEAKEKMKIAAKTKPPMTNITKNKIREASKNRSEEVKLKIILSNTGKKRSKEFCEQLSKRLTGHAVSQKTRDKISKNNKGRIISEETKARMSKSSNRLKMSESNKQKLIKKNSKIIYQFDLNMNFIKEWSSVMEASRELKINNKNICSVCKNKRNKAGNFKWKYKNE
jgi:group I intron endonuclease